MTDMVDSQSDHVNIEVGAKALLPASPLQVRMALIDSMNDTHAAFNLAAHMHLSGGWEVARIVRALHRLTDRYEILRTNIVRAGTEILQAVSRPGESYPKIEIKTVDSVSKADLRDYLAKIGSDIATKPFNIALDWLFRATLVRESDDHCHLVLSLHHVVGDALTFRTLLSEFFILYRDDIDVDSGEHLEFADYLSWRQDGKDEQREQSEIAFWKAELAGAPFLVDMTSDRRRSGRLSFRGARLETAITDELAASVQKLAEDLHITSAAVYLAAFAIVMQSRSNQSDLVLGIPSIDLDGQAMNVVGPLLDMLPCRLKLSGDVPFVEFVQIVSQRLRACQVHSSVSFDRIVQVVNPSRVAGNRPLFNVVFAHEQLEPVTTGMADLSVEIVELDNESAQYELSLFVTTTGARTQLAWQYCTDLFDREIVDFIGESLIVLLKAVVELPQSTIAQLPICGDKESAVIARMTQSADLDRNDKITDRELAINCGVQQQNDMWAISDGRSKLTFATLAEKVEYAARALLAKCATDISPIAIVMPLSVDAVVAIFAAMDAGKCFIPIDIGLPAERVQAIMADAGCKFAISVAGHGIAGTETVSVDELIAKGASLEAIDASPADDALVYLAYTSGSTGKPKGVETTRSNLKHFLRALDHLVPLSENMVWLALTPISFDMSVIETIWPLTRGIPITIAPTQTIIAGESSITRMVRDDKVSHMITTPAILKVLMQSNDFRSAANEMRCIMLGGERFDAELAKSLRSVFEGVTINAYGPTEATVFCISHELAKYEEDWVPVGRPVAGMKAYILDSFGRPAVMGARGELVVGGGQVCQGYLGLKERTDTSFFQMEGTRWYRTGDVASFHPRGIRIHERIDRQVKIAGNRVELGEIETVVGRHPEVKAAVCIADKRQGGSPVIRVFVTADRSAGEGLPDRLKRYCRDHLVAAAIPTTIIRVETFPLASSGKLDELALLKFADNHVSSSSGPDRPQIGSDIEREIYEAWATTLGRTDFGTDDNFFEVGGSSMELLSLLDMLNEKFPDQFDITKMVEGGTVSAMAAQISQAEPVTESNVYEF